jgi:Rieske Fe-S protein
MTYGTIGAMLLSDLILELPNPWTKLFDATRLHVLASAGKFVTENKDFIGYFVGDRISNGDAHSTDEIGRGQGKLITIDGKKVAAYRDEEGNLHTLSAVCPHMGCHVHWNNAESTWDCPCHGSRFDATGKVANGPAVTDLKAVEVPHPAEAK